MRDRRSVSCGTTCRILTVRTLPWNIVFSIFVVLAIGGCDYQPSPNQNRAITHTPPPNPAWLPTSFFPAWKDAVPGSTINLYYDSTIGQEANGLILKSAIQGLTAGQRLVIGPGTWSISPKFDVVLQGTSTNPIWITGDPNNRPIITRPDTGQNVMNVGESGATKFVAFSGLEFTGGDTLVKLYDCSNIWIDHCYIHDGDGVGISANASDTDHLYITYNEIDKPGNLGDKGEGLYLGGNNGSVIMSYSVIARNYVHDTANADQGDGIELKQGSHHNWIVENTVHTTKYPCILVYGTGGNGTNVIERNLCWNAQDNTMQVQGEAYVRNNMIVAGKASGFASHNHQGQTKDLIFTHNTVVNSGRGADLISWNGTSGMIFSNNVIYSQNQESIRFPNGSQGVTFSGNVVLGPVIGANGGYVFGSGLADFVNGSWSGSPADYTPAPGGPIIGEGDTAWAEPVSIKGTLRTGTLEPGAYDAP